VFIAGNGSFRQVAQDVRDLLQSGPQVFGELAHWHPHIHAPVSDGAFARDGTFARVPEIAVEPFLKLWEKALFDLLLSEGRITEQMRSQV
jgi:hypothetical protein